MHNRPHALARLLGVLVLSAWGCGGAQECPPCAEAPPPPTLEGTLLNDWESRVLADDLADLRAGVRPLDDKSLGVCKGARRCDELLGLSPGELPPGDYVLHADLKVPKIGAGWKARFAVNCEVQGPNGSSKTSHEKVYDIAWSSDPTRGYRLSPLWTVRSPYKEGARSCEFTLTPLRPDGSEQEPMRGSFSTPAPT